MVIHAGDSANIGVLNLYARDRIPELLEIVVTTTSPIVTHSYNAEITIVTNISKTLTEAVVESLLTSTIIPEVKNKLINATGTRISITQRRVVKTLVAAEASYKLYRNTEKTVEVVLK